MSDEIMSAASLRGRMEAARLQRVRAQQMLKALFARHRLATRLFCDDDGSLSADGEAFFALVADRAGVGILTQANSDREENWRSGQRALALWIMDLVDVDQKHLAKLSRVTSGGNDDD